jgi:hypothetical protein
MDFDVYCDESRPDLFASRRDTIGRYMLIGSVWLPTINADAFKEEIKQIRQRHSVFGEVKWRNVAPSKLGFYLELADWFFAKGEACRFRTIVVEASEVDLTRFHESDQELGFYKFYYQLLHHWILDFNRYRIYVDHKPNRDRRRLPVLRRCLAYTNLTSAIERVQALDSTDSQFIQLADLLTGASAARLHNLAKSPARSQLVERIERHLKRHIGPTARAENKFNVFKIGLGGGW